MTLKQKMKKVLDEQGTRRDYLKDRLETGFQRQIEVLQCEFSRGCVGAVEGMLRDAQEHATILDFIEMFDAYWEYDDARFEEETRAWVERNIRLLMSYAGSPRQIEVTVAETIRRQITLIERCL